MTSLAPPKNREDNLMTDHLQHPGGDDVRSTMELAWLTNLDAPYRRPVWADLAQRWDLTVALTASATSADGRVRGADWFEQGARSYRVRHLRTGSIDLRGSTYAVGVGGLREVVPHRGAVVLGGWESPVYWQASELARRRGSTRIGFYESTLRSQGHGSGPVARARRRFFHALDAVVVPGTAAAEAVLAMGVAPDRVVTGFNAVDVRGINAEARRTRGSQEQGATGHRFVFLGQLIRRKNVAALLTAFASIAGSDDTLDLFGDGDDADRLRALARSDERLERVTFHPTVAHGQVAAALATRHTLLLPSSVEVWGLVVNEALAAGLHVVVSDSCGVTPSVEHMRGVFSSGTGPVSIARAMTASREAWSGWIDAPEILAHTPEAFARDFDRALEQTR